MTLLKAYRIGGLSIAADTPSESIADEIVFEHNEARRQNHLPVLLRYSVLDELAAIRCADMVEENYFSHDDPNMDVGKYDDLLKRHFSTWKLAGENLWAGSTGFTVGEIPFSVVRGFLNSPGHAQNVLEPVFDCMGVAIQFRPADGWTVVTCIYAGGLVPLP